jgi:hypothetical protein
MNGLSAILLAGKKPENVLAGTGIRTKYRNPDIIQESCPTGFPAKNSCDIGKKQEVLQPPQNDVPVKNSSGKHSKKRNPQESCSICF